MLRRLLQFFTKTKIVVVDRELILLETINSLTKQLERLSLENSELKSKKDLKFEYPATLNAKPIPGISTWDDERFQLEQESRQRARNKTA